jgi:hypothetical protein
MPVTINGTNGITFNNSSTQAQSAGLGSSATAQTWQNVAASRALGTTYTNSTGYPIELAFVTYSAGPSTLSINGSVVIENGAFSSAYGTFSLIIPNGATYVINGGTIARWWELR